MRTAAIVGTASVVGGSRRPPPAAEVRRPGRAAAAGSARRSTTSRHLRRRRPRPTDPTEELTKLAQLHSQGILTDEEFSAKKAQILGI